MNIVMPMAGRGNRLAAYDYTVPKPLIEICGKPIVEWAIRTVGLKGNFIFCCKKDHIENFSLDEKLKKIVPNCNIISINYNTAGTAQTILEAIKFIDNDDELFISDSDHYMFWNSIQFLSEARTKNIDACILIFPEKQSSPDYSYVKLNENGYVIEAAEKIPISETAGAGMHYFRKGKDFVKYARKMIKKNIRFNNEFYVTPIYNEFYSDNKKVITFPVKRKWALGDKYEINEFEKDKPFLQTQ